MHPPPPAGHWQVALIGYGEVGRILAEDLRAAGHEVRAHDVALPRGDAAAAAMRAHADAHGVLLADSHRGCVDGVDLVVSAVTASQTVAVAAACAPGIATGTWFLDFNSASPGAKRRAAEAIGAAGGRYVEGAVMTSVPPYRIRVPLLLGGPYARELAPLLAGIGFAAEFASDELGIASATKMCRSILIKGLEAMVIEALTTARAHGVENAVIASLGETFPSIDWETQATYFFQRVIQHGRRRAEEVREAAQTAREVGLTSWSADGTARRQAWVADLADTGLFGDPSTPRTDWRMEADRILDAIRRAND
jgi:3-hydroxyisobutyrate dehydrogenase-like beta-hydroxyacid dehydrogenase